MTKLAMNVFGFLAVAFMTLGLISQGADVSAATAYVDIEGDGTCSCQVSGKTYQNGGACTDVQNTQSNCSIQGAKCKLITGPNGASYDCFAPA